MKCPHVILALTFGMTLPVVAHAQTFDSVAECQTLKSEITATMADARGLESLLVQDNLGIEDYLSQLYEGVKILTKTGEAFFKAADEHEAACRLKLQQANKIEEIRGIYDWYLEPAKLAYQFFRRARETAVRLNRQADVDALNTIMTEYDDAMMKLVSVCQSDLEGTPHAEMCTQYSARLAEALADR